MRDKIVEIFIGNKRNQTVVIKNTINIDPMQKNDDIQQHLLQKPIKSGYTNNQPQ
jgi:hypothetical protein